jgi:hypothetical protein
LTKDATQKLTAYAISLENVNEQFVVQPHKTPDSCLEMERQPGGSKLI